MNVDQFLLVVSDFVNNGEMVVISQVSCLYVNPIKPIMVTDFLSECFLNVGVLKLSSKSLVNVGCDKSPVFLDGNINFNLLVSHILK